MTIGRLILDKRLTAIMRTFYRIGMFRLKFKSSIDGKIPFEYELNGRKNRPSYTYRIRWNYWNPMNIVLVAAFVLGYIGVTLIWTGVKGLSEILPGLWNAFIITKYQSA